MAGKVISHKQLSKTLTMTEDNRGFWLWDSTRGMNLAMYEKTSESALITALMYYQNRFLTLEEKHKILTKKVDSFLTQFELEENYHA